MFFHLFAAFLSLIPASKRTDLVSTPPAMRSSMAFRNRGENGFAEPFLATLQHFFLFYLKEGLFKSPFLNGITKKQCLIRVETIL